MVIGGRETATVTLHVSGIPWQSSPPYAITPTITLTALHNGSYRATCFLQSLPLSKSIGATLPLPHILKDTDGRASSQKRPVKEIPLTLKGCKWASLQGGGGAV